MGKYFLLVLLGICSFNIYAQDCPDFSFTLESQEDIDEFFTLYPNCTNIIKNIRIGDLSGPSTITDLSQLSQITSIDGDLIISNNPQLENLNGLQNITDVGLNLEIFSNRSLTDLTEINQIERIGEDLIIKRNQSLTALGVFTKLDSIHEKIELLEIPITNVDAFPNLKFVKDLTIENTNIERLNGFDNLLDVNGSLIIIRNSLLELIDGFSALKFSKNLSIIGNTNLVNLSGLENLGHISNEFRFSGCDGLVSFSGSFASLDSIGGEFRFEENPLLVAFPQFDQLIKTSSIYFSGNDGLLDLSGLESLKELSGEINIRFNDNLKSLSGLNNIDPDLVTKMTLWNNPNLETCNIPSICEVLKRGITWDIIGNANGCASFEEIYINQCRNHECLTGGLLITNQEQIDNFDTNYPHCRYLNGDLIIGDESGVINSTVTDLIGLNKLDTIWGNIIVENNQELEFLRGLEGIEYLNADLNIENNPILSEIDIIRRSQIIRGSLIVKDNPSLTMQINPSNVIAVNGDVEYKNNPVLTDVSTLDDLIYIRGSFMFENNDAYVSKIEMEVLESVGGDFIYKNNAESSQPLDTRSLRIIGGDLIITNNESFREFNSWGVDTIVGNFICNENPSLNSFRPEGLKTIFGNLNLNSNEKLNYIESTQSSFSHLSGDLIIKNNPSLGLGIAEGASVIKLTELTSINGKLEITDNPELTTLSGLERIAHDGITSLTITDNEKLKYCEIQAVCGSIMANAIDVNINGNNSKCETKDSVRQECDLSYCWLGDITLRSQDDVDRFVSANPTCSIINGELSIERNDIEDLSGLQNLKLVKGKLSINTGDKLESLVGLHNLEQVGSIQISAFLKNLRGLESLKSVEGEFFVREGRLESLEGLENLERVGSMHMFATNYLPSFKGLEALRRIDNNFQITSSNGFESLDGLENVEEFSGRITIFSCDELVDINGINNFPVDSISRIEISSNEKLQVCTSKLFCEFLYLNPSQTIIVLGNGIGCRSDDDLDCRKYSLSGQVYFDSNENGEKDDNEYGIKGIEVNIAPTLGIPVTNEEGKYFQYADSGSVYIITLAPNIDWELTSIEESYVVTFDSSDIENYNFGLKPTFERHSSTASLTAENNRCNEEGKFYIKIQNTGTFTESGEVVLTLDPLLEYISSDIDPTSFDETNNILIWEYDEIYPYQIFDIEVDVNMPDQSSTGTILENMIEHYALIDTNLELIGSENSEVEVRCSYDPNDKRVSPAGVGEEAYVLKGEPLTYTIRFQNTGNDYAKNVRLVDTIAPQFDMRSFELLNSSHEVFTLIEGRVVTFVYDNIYLVDSLTNEAASHGFVSFKINLLDNNEDFLLVENFADIYFDFNPPIRTNTAISTIVEKIPTATNDFEKNISIQVRPNPAGNDIKILSPINGRFDIYNARMKKVVNTRLVNANQSQSVDLSSWASGVYFIKLRSENGTVVTKVFLKL